MKTQTFKNSGNGAEAENNAENDAEAENNAEENKENVAAAAIEEIDPDQK